MYCLRYVRCITHALIQKVLMEKPAANHENLGNIPSKMAGELCRECRITSYCLASGTICGDFLPLIKLQECAVFSMFMLCGRSLLQ